LRLGRSVVPAIDPRTLFFKPMKSKSEFELALDVLAVVRRGEVLTIDEIAKVVGCDRHTIMNIERRALKKLRERLKRSGIDEEDFLRPVVAG